MARTPNLLWLESFGLFDSKAQAQPAMKEFLTGRIPAKFDLSGLSINPAQVEANNQVTVVINVKNSGGISGIYSVDLKLNGLAVESKKVTLNSGAQSEVSFTVIKTVAGSYNVGVGSLSGSFIVKAPLKPVSINLKSLVISRTSVKSGEEVTVNATLENTGELLGAYDLIFSIDGVQKNPSSVTIDGGKTVISTMKFSSTIEGNHTITVGSKSVTFSVEKTVVTQTDVDGYPVESVIIGLILVVIFSLIYKKN
jgi:hypothetical protein